MDRKLDELLYALMQNMMITVSGEKLARDLNVSHSTLARWIEKLRGAGVEIRGELFTGYRLARLPDVLLPQLVRPRLRTTMIGRVLYHFYSVDSTNAFAARLFAHGHKVAEGAIIIAEAQTAGRGRLGRAWHSERETRLDVDIKWPNDLLIDNRKVCGILSEIQAEVDLLKTMIIGVGVNVNHERLPAD